jgi:hypothetical protein
MRPAAPLAAAIALLLFVTACASSSPHSLTALVSPSTTGTASAVPSAVEPATLAPISSLPTPDRATPLTPTPVASATLGPVLTVAPEDNTAAGMLLAQGILANKAESILRRAAKRVEHGDAFGAAQEFQRGTFLYDIYFFLWATPSDCWREAFTKYKSAARAISIAFQGLWRIFAAGFIPPRVEFEQALARMRRAQTKLDDAIVVARARLDCA